MVGHGPSPIRDADRNPVDCAALPSFPDMLLARRAPEGIDRKMLRQDQGVADRLLDPGLVKAHLDGARLLVVCQPKL